MDFLDVLAVSRKDWRICDAEKGSAVIRADETGRRVFNRDDGIDFLLDRDIVFSSFSPMLTGRPG